MTNKTTKVEITLTLEELRALKEVSEVYLNKGPAWECAQLWDTPHEGDTLLSLNTKIQALP